MSNDEFEDVEKITILMKETFEVTNTNELKAWYLETQVPYNTYTNGEDIFIDEFNVNLGEDWWNNTTVEPTISNVYADHGLNKETDFSQDTDSGIYVSPDGKLQRFEKLRLDSITGADLNVTPPNLNTSYSYTKITMGDRNRRKSRNNENS